ncbi:unnamed protein product [Schistosoma turkestanicum]|nr:unnamed protein product [Schistosoma turkestanicum]
MIKTAHSVSNLNSNLELSPSVIKRTQSSHFVQILDESMCVVREDLTEWLQRYLFSTANACPIAAHYLLCRLASGLWLSRLAYKLHYSILKSGYENAMKAKTLSTSIHKNNENNDNRSYEFLRGAVSNRDLKNLTPLSLPSFPSTLTDCAKLPLGPTDLCSFSSPIPTYEHDSDISNFDVDFPKENISIKSRVADRWIARDNVSAFIKWCKDLGVPETILFETNGLMNKTEEKNVLLTLMEVARIASRYGLTDLPYLVRMEREIDELEAKHSQDQSDMHHLCHNNNNNDTNKNHYSTHGVINLERIDHENRKSKSHKSSHFNSIPDDKRMNGNSSESQSIDKKNNDSAVQTSTDNRDISCDYNISLLSNHCSQNGDTTTNTTTNTTTTTTNATNTINSNSHLINANGMYDKNQCKLCRNNSSQVDDQNSACPHHCHDTDNSNSAKRLRALNNCSLMSLEDNNNNNNNNDDDSLNKVVGTDQFVQQQVNKKLAQCTCCHRLHMQRLEEGRYRLGSRIYYLRRFRNHVMVRVGGGWLTLDEFLQRHDPCRRRIHSCDMGPSVVSDGIPPIKSCFNVSKPIRRNTEFESPSISRINSMNHFNRQSSNGSNSSVESPRSDSSIIDPGMIVSEISSGGSISHTSSLNSLKQKQQKPITTTTPLHTIPKAPNLRTASRSRDSSKKNTDSTNKTPNNTTDISHSRASSAKRTNIPVDNNKTNVRTSSRPRSIVASKREDSVSRPMNMRKVSQSREEVTTTRTPWRN